MTITIIDALKAYRSDQFLIPMDDVYSQEMANLCQTCDQAGMIKLLQAHPHTAKVIRWFRFIHRYYQVPLDGIDNEDILLAAKTIKEELIAHRQALHMIFDGAEVADSAYDDYVQDILNDPDRPFVVSLGLGYLQFYG